MNELNELKKLYKTLGKIIDSMENKNSDDNDEWEDEAPTMKSMRSGILANLSVGNEWEDEESVEEEPKLSKLEEIRRTKPKYTGLNRNIRLC